MAEVRTVHTACLGAAELAAIRALVDGAFEDDVSDEDHEHALGGLHALVWDGRELIGHGSVVMRRMLHEGRALRCGYVEAVAVRADRRGHGHGAAVMAALERVIRAAYELGALSAARAARDFYVARGWSQWTGTTSVLAPDGIRRTPGEEGGIYVLSAGVDLAPRGDLACDWRDGEVW